MNNGILTLLGLSVDQVKIYGQDIPSKPSLKRRTTPFSINSPVKFKRKMSEMKIMFYNGYSSISTDFSSNAFLDCHFIEEN